MPERAEVDSIDRQILDLLVEDGRRTLTDIAERVSLSPAPVKRRIDRLEQTGVIAGYTAVLDHSRLGESIEAFAELRFAGDIDVDSMTRAAVLPPEVVEVFTIAGDPDALVRIRVRNVRHLRQVIDTMRRSGTVIGTKTLMVLGSWQRASH